MTEENKRQDGKPKKRTRFDVIKEKIGGSIKFSFVFFSAIHIAKIVIASMYLKQCPVEPDIPKYLLALGVLGLATKIVTLLKDFLIKFMKIAPILSFITTAELAMLIVGSYYVYREYKPSYEPLSLRYCNKTLYLFAFSYITIVYCLLLLLIVGLGCFIFTLVVLNKYNLPEDDVENTAIEGLTEPENKTTTT